MTIDVPEFWRAVAAWPDKVEPFISAITWTRGDNSMLEQLATRARDRIKGETGISPEIIALIELIIQAVMQCMPKRAQFLAFSKSPTLTQRAALNISIRRELGLSRRADVLKAQSAILTTAADATDEELGQAHQEACEVLGIDYNHDPSN